MDHFSRKRKRESKSNYEQHYLYEKNEFEELQGTCLLCEKKKIKRVIKRTHGNTSGLKRHLETAHLDEYKKMFPESHLVPSQQKTITECLPQNKKSDDMDRILVCWLAHKNLPYSFFNDSTTQNFFKTFNRSLSVPKKTAMHDTAMVQFLKMQTNLKTVLANNDSKVSFTVDAWSSKNFKSYYGITVHFVDENWKLQSIALDLIQSEGKHSGKDIARLFVTVVISFGLEKCIQGITVDNASSNTTFLKELSFLLEKINIKFDHENQHFRCIAHILNLGAQDVLRLINSPTDEDFKLTVDETDGVENLDYSDSDDFDDLDEITDQTFGNIISRVKSTCKEIRNSEVLTSRLKSLCEAVNIDYVKPILDVVTRWNSSFDMLEVITKLKPAIKILWENCKEITDYRLNDSEWAIVQKITEFLKYFKYLSKIVSTEKTANMPSAVVGFNILLDRIESIVKDLDEKNNRNADDEKLLLAFQAGRDKLVKHYKKFNWMYAVCLILDPRHKVYSFDLTSWGKELKLEAESKFEKIYKESYFDVFNTDIENEKPNKSGDPDVLNFNSFYLQETEPMNWKKEIIAYTETPRANVEINILKWWKDHECSFPILSKMARDFLSIMPSSVPVERLFSDASLIVTKQRCSMKYESIRTMLCIHSWMKSDLKNKICEVSI